MRTPSSFPSGVALLGEAEVRQLITMRDAIEAVRAGFAALGDGLAVVPQPIEVDFPHRHADLHVKGAFVQTLPIFSFKVVTGFYGNEQHGLPTSSGATLAFDSATGILRAVIIDNGFLTDLRTGAAGAVAADLLAQKTIDVVAVVGAGRQAIYQLEALVEVRSPTFVRIYNRSGERALKLSRVIKDRWNLDSEVVPSVERACRDAQVIITTTPSREPLVQAPWVAHGAHITAVGSDLPSKQELDVDLLARADVLVADSVEQCAHSGEIHHALAARKIVASDVVELSKVAAGHARGRMSREQITIADLTGVGVQDVAVVNHVVSHAESRTRDEPGSV